MLSVSLKVDVHLLVLFLCTHNTVSITTLCPSQEYINFKRCLVQPELLSWKVFPLRYTRFCTSWTWFLPIWLGFYQRAHRASKRVNCYGDLQASLCRFQCFFWHATEQYAAISQPLQTLNFVPVVALFPHWKHRGCSRLSCVLCVTCACESFL